MEPLQYIKPMVIGKLEQIDLVNGMRKGFYELRRYIRCPDCGGRMEIRADGTEIELNEAMPTTTPHQCKSAEEIATERAYKSLVMCTENPRKIMYCCEACVLAI